MKIGSSFSIWRWTVRSARGFEFTPGEMEHADEVEFLFLGSGLAFEGDDGGPVYFATAEWRQWEWPASSPERWIVLGESGAEAYATDYSRLGEGHACQGACVCVAGD
jgi:hypothetical protein